MPPFFFFFHCFLSSFFFLFFFLLLFLYLSFFVFFFFCISIQQRRIKQKQTKTTTTKIRVVRCVHAPDPATAHNQARRGQKQQSAETNDAAGGKMKASEGAQAAITRPHPLNTPMNTKRRGLGSAAVITAQGPRASSSLQKPPHSVRSLDREGRGWRVHV